MKLLLDANLSWRLTAALSEHFGECAHVNKTGLPLPPTDSQIRKEAEAILLRAKTLIEELDQGTMGLLEII
jgi:predicted nuclease of predicted toxin-antitoxin system